MIHPILQKNWISEPEPILKKVSIGLSVAFLFLLALAILQDLIHSTRNGYAFYLSESLLFKTVWILYIPILGILHHRLKREKLDRPAKTLALMGVPMVLHFLLVPVLSLILSQLFFEGRYDLYKFTSHTLAHDITSLVIIYCGFVLGHRFFQKGPKQPAETLKTEVLNTLVLKHGNGNTIIQVEDIVQIASATPYISIHLEHKKFLYPGTLKSICQHLDGRGFIRIHKSTVVNSAMVLSFKSRRNGDYDLLLNNGDVVRLSRTYARDFKEHFDPRHRDTP